jgi:hypothetical protein
MKNHIVPSGRPTPAGPYQRCPCLIDRRPPPPCLAIAGRWAPRSSAAPRIDRPPRAHRTEPPLPPYSAMCRALLLSPFPISVSSKKPLSHPPPTPRAWPLGSQKEPERRPSLWWVRLSSPCNQSALSVATITLFGEHHHLGFSSSFDWCLTFHTPS